MKQSLYSQKVSLNYRVSFEYFGGNWLCFNLTIVWSSRIILPSSLNYKTHFSRQLNCWSLRCSWSIACQRCSSYIFIVDATTGLNGLGKDNFKKRRESVKFWDLVQSYITVFHMWWFIKIYPCHHGAALYKSLPKCFSNDLYFVISTAVPSIELSRRQHQSQQQQRHFHPSQHTTSTHTVQPAECQTMYTVTLHIGTAKGKLGPLPT